MVDEKKDVSEQQDRGLQSVQDDLLRLEISGSGGSSQSSGARGPAGSSSTLGKKIKRTPLKEEAQSLTGSLLTPDSDCRLSSSSTSFAVSSTCAGKYHRRDQLRNGSGAGGQQHESCVGFSPLLNTSASLEDDILPSRAAPPQARFFRRQATSFGETSTNSNPVQESESATNKFRTHEHASSGLVRPPVFAQRRHQQHFPQDRGTAGVPAGGFPTTHLVGNCRVVFNSSMASYRGDVSHLQNGYSIPTCPSCRRESFSLFFFSIQYT
jgi:hypothetical protein